ncbi:MAG: hypothetical protein HOM97_12875 [Nitrospina sp.]|jgi:lysophospholipase L1-like esterase|nr:hypothetical protein [Nitrospina sp.]
MTLLKKLKAPLIFILIGLLTVPWEEHEKWVWRGMILYSLPLLCYAIGSAKSKEWGFLIGLCMILQAIASPIIIDKISLRDYVTLEPNFHNTINVKKGSITGIEGEQGYTTDEKGFRVTKKINYDNKPDNTLRIFTVGASTVEGMLLGDHVNWPPLLQNKLNETLTSKNTEVINTGKSATTARNHLATLKQITKYEPDLVVFLLGGNDWHSHITVSQAPEKHSVGFLSKLGIHLPTKTKECIHVIRIATRFDYTIIAEIFKTIKLRFKKTERKQDSIYQNFAGGAIVTYMGSLNRPDKRVFRPAQVTPEYRYFVAEMVDTCKDKNIACVFANQPTAYQNDAGDEIKKTFWITPFEEEYTLDFPSLVHIASLYNEFLIKYARDNHVTGCDLASQTPPTFDYFWDGVHFNIGGAKKASEIIFECVMKTLGTKTN